MADSSSTGKRIFQMAVPQLKCAVLELFDKGPMCIFHDVKDLTQVAANAVAYSLSNTGQVCCSIERVYMAKAIHEEFCQAVVEAMSKPWAYHVGNNGLDKGVMVGPLVSIMQHNHIHAHVQDALDQGATLLYQGEILTEPLEHTSFFPVMVLANV